MAAISLKTKMTCAVSLLVALLLFAAGYVSLAYFERQFKETISRQQFTMVSAMADQIDDKMFTAQEVLVLVAKTITPEVVGDPAKAQHFIDSRLVTPLLFDNGIYLFSPSGRLIAGTHLEPGMRGASYAASGFLRQTLATKKPFISEPFLSSQRHQHPVIMMTVPVFAANGELIAVFVGSLDLLQDNFLGRLANIRLGENGYLYLYSTDRTIIVHNDRNRILKQDVPVGANKLFDKALAGFEGTGETINSRGLAVLSSFKRLKSANLILASNYPLNEAHAPIYKAKSYFFAGLAALVLLSTILVWYFMRFLTAPLLLITSHVRQITGQEHEQKPLRINTRDEIGTLAEAFNKMLAELHQQKMQLQSQLHFLQVLIDTMPNPVFYKDVNGRYLGCNNAFVKFTGLAREQVIGKTVQEVAPPDMAAVYDAADQKLFRQGTVQVYESSVRNADGTEYDAVIYKGVFANADGSLGGMVGTILDISERKRAEAALKEQQAFSESLVQNSAVPTFVLDARHRVVIWNRACEQMTGMLATVVIGTDSHWRAFYDQRRSCLADVVIDRNLEELPTNYISYGNSPLIPDGLHAEGWFPKISGRERYLNFNAAPIRNSSGELVAVIETLDDITERKLAEELLRKQQGLMNNVIANIPHSVFWKDHNSVYLGCNGNFARNAGLAGPEEIVGKTDYDLPWKREEADFYRKCDREVMDKGCPLLEIEETQQQADGAEVMILTSKVPLRGTDGSVTGLLGIYSDISERKRGETELKRTLSLLAATLEATADGILVTDLTGMIVSFNRRFAEMWQIPEELLARQDIAKSRSFVLDQLKDPDGFLARGDELTGNPALESHDVLEFKDGRVFERFSMPQKIGSEIIGRVRSFRDITSQRKLEGQLRHAQKMEAIGTLTGGIAHDFNNVLTAIIGYANLLQMKIDRADPMLHYVKQMLAAADRAAGLTHGLLTYSRKQPINPKPIDLNELVQRVDDFLSRIIGENIELATVFAEEQLMILADGGQVEQVLMNLATNARDAMAGQGSLIISTRVVDLDEGFIQSNGFGKAGRYALLSVSDTGSGMDKQTRERIFEPFFTTKELGKGTGLGLSIVYGIVKQHDGYINLYSEPGNGTTFRVYFPLSGRGLPETAAAPQPTQLEGKETILLVEDNQEVRQLFKLVLERSGYRVIEAVDGDEALSKFEQHQGEIKLLLVDVIMPKMNGREVYDAIRRHRSEIKAIFTSGYTADIINKKGVLDTELDFLSKPLSPNRLLAKIREVLDR